MFEHNQQQETLFSAWLSLMKIQTVSKLNSFCHRCSLHNFAVNGNQSWGPKTYVMRVDNVWRYDIIKYWKLKLPHESTTSTSTLSDLQPMFRLTYQQTKQINSYLPMFYDEIVVLWLSRARGHAGNTVQKNSQIKTAPSLLKK